MLRDGMPVDVCYENGLTALFVATIENRTDVIKHLLHERADVNRQARYTKNTPLHWAARNNNTEVTRMLIDKGADDNKTALDVADKGSKVERLLMQLQQNAP